MDAPVMKSLPQSIEAEQAVLGAMMVDRGAIAKSAEALSAEDFYRDSHKIIFKSIVEMFQKDNAVDQVTLVEYLLSSDKLEKAGGITYLSEMEGSVIDAANINDYIKIVEDKATLRRLIKASTDIISTCYNEQGDVLKVVDSAEKKIFDISETKNSGDFESISDVLERGFQVKVPL